MMRVSRDLAQTLAVVIDEGSLDAASRRLHVTPSAVSQRLKALEESVGQVLLIRSKPVRPTVAGQSVARFARAVALLERDVATGLELDPAQTGIALAVNADSMATWLLPPLARIGARRGVVFDLHRGDQDHTASLLEEGTVLAAITSRARPVAGCRAVALGAMRYRAVASPGFVERWFPDGVTPAALTRAPLVRFDRDDLLQRSWLDAQGVAASPPSHVVPASEDFARAVGLGMGWGLLPLIQCARGLRDGELVRLAGDPVDVPLHWQRWDLRSTLLDEVEQEVVAAARRALVA